MEDPKESNFVSGKLNLPLFMVSRIPLKENQLQGNIRDYISSKRLHFLSTWDEELIRQHDYYTIRKNLHILGKDNKKPKFLCDKKPKITEIPTTNKYRPWQLPPNRYGLETKPFANKAGLKGAYWRKAHNSKPRKTYARKAHFTLYSLPRESERMDRPCHKHKSFFLSNARDRKPSSRSMIENNSFKDPNEPSPATYNPKHPGKSYEIAKPVRDLFSSKYVFYRNSIVPRKPNSVHPPNISFLPGPGRYEIRYKNICHCSRYKKYQPELDLIIDRQKRNKFRRIPQKKIKVNLYCSPDWRHVRGNGYPHLFMGGAKPQGTSVKAKDTAKDKKKQLKLFHDAKYMNMIWDPKNDLGSIRTEPMPEKPKKIKFDRMIKVISRKQLRSNRKLAFGSSAERWKDDEKPPVLTPEQIRKILSRIPPERRLRDHPVMFKKPEEIKPKLDRIPDFLLPNYIPKLRKRLFKFSPLPPAKILIKDEDIRPLEPAKHGYYFRPLDPKKYFKDHKD